MADQYNDLECRLSDYPHVMLADTFCVTLGMDSARRLYCTFQGSLTPAQWSGELQKLNYQMAGMAAF